MHVTLNKNDVTYQIMMSMGKSDHIDYAQMTSGNFMQSFRHILQKPDLSRAQLSSMLRGIERHRQNPRINLQWPSFIADMLQKQANSNIYTATKFQ